MSDAAADKKITYKVLSIGVPRGQTDIMEIFSQDRVGKMAKDYEFVKGSSFDLLTGWNLGDAANREKMLKIYDDEKPMLVIGSPPCKRFSVLMNLLMGRNLSAGQRDKFHAELDEAIEHIRFCVKIYKKQIEAGRYFLHEHPATASS